MSKRYPGGIIRKTPPTTSQTSAQGIWDMASVTQAVKENTWPIAGVPDPISKSLRFRASASAYLSRTPASAGNRKTWTYSTWLKRGAVGAEGTIISGGATTGRLCVFFNSSGQLVSDIGGTGTYDQSTAVYRDPSAWYHFVWQFDTTQATAANRSRMYINGVQVTLTNTRTFTQNADYEINNSVLQTLGTFSNSIGTYNFDGYQAETYFIDGQALTPSSFGNTNDQTGIWQPIAYTGTYGTNGFYLPFSNTASTATLGYDFSGNSNNWTTNNISLTSGSTYDSMVDVPTQWIPYNTAGDTGALFRGNYCTWNPLAGDTSKITVSDGNLNAQGSSTSCSIGGTMQLLSGKWYWEVTITKSNVQQVGIIGDTLLKMNASVTAGDSPGGYIYLSNGAFYNNNTTSLSGSSYTTNDVISVAYDADSRKLWFAKNGTWQNSGVPASGTGQVFTTSSSYTYIPVASAGLGTDQVGQKINFGQQPFSYTPPTGFKTLCTTNLPTPTIGATASTQASKYMNIVLYTGDNSSSPRSITGFGFSPDFVWVKARSNTIDHNLWNSVMGAGASQGLHSNTNAAAGDSGNFAIYGYVSSLDSDGFTVTKGSDATYGNFWHNYTSTTYVAWAWDANGSGSSNTDGSITSTVSVNTTAGFSIITFTGNGSAGATIGHGLGVAPELLIFKGRNTGTDGLTWFRAYNTNQGQMQLDSTAGIYNPGNGLYFNSTYPSSSVITLGTSGSTNGSTQTYVVYAFAPIAGYSAFGSYTGNGSTDGPFIYTGFRPRYILTKGTGASRGWNIQDTARGTYNAITNILEADLSDAEATNSVYAIDLLSNGFKLRNSNTYWNGSGETYVYMAFAESPFKFALAR